MRISVQAPYCLSPYRSLGLNMSLQKMPRLIGGSISLGKIDSKARRTLIDVTCLHFVHLMSSGNRVYWDQNLNLTGFRPD